MGRQDKREQELLEQEKQALEESNPLEASKQDGFDIDGNGVVDADESKEINNDEEYRRGYHK